MSGRGVGKRKIVGTLKREILRLAKLTPFGCTQGEQDDYPCRIVNLAAHRRRNFMRETII